MSTSASSSNRFPELDKFELLEEIGHGGMATVYRARDLRLGREVAVKVIHKHLRENAEVRRRFTSEARAVAMLRHPGIVDVYDVSDDEEPERYLVVELIRGRSLRQILQQHEVLPAEVSASIVALLCDAVQHAHENGVIHRDIKPENVLIELPSDRRDRPSDGEGAEREDEPEAGALGGQRSSRTRAQRASERASSDRGGVVVKLTDFGIAKVLDVQGVTSTGQILGSPAHMAPEQIEGGNVGPHTDVFALGVLMYESMVGHLPFEGKNPAQVLRRVLDGTFEPADTERAVVGGRWARIVARALYVDIETRLSTARAFGSLVDEELAALGVANPRQELATYFEDPEAYRQQQRGPLVSRLLARGELERRQQNIPLAAADFNRALAFRPEDLAILRRVSSLSAQTLWRERGRMLGLLAVLVAVAFGGGYGVTRVWKPGETDLGADTSLPTAHPDVPSVTPTHDSVPQSSERPGPPEVSAHPRQAVSGGPSASPGPDPQPSATVAAGGTRTVRFGLNPGTANLEVDGVERKGFPLQVVLDVGSHHFRAWPGTADPCCKEAAGTFIVESPPPDRPDEVQSVTVSLPKYPATATLSGAPPSGFVTCNNGLTVTAGASSTVEMLQMEKPVTCTFMPGGKSVSVTLRAGRGTTIQWAGE